MRVSVECAHQTIQYYLIFVTGSNSIVILKKTFIVKLNMIYVWNMMALMLLTLLATIPVGDDHYDNAVVS